MTINPEIESIKRTSFTVPATAGALAAALTHPDIPSSADIIDLRVVVADTEPDYDVSDVLEGRNVQNMDECVYVELEWEA